MLSMPDNSREHLYHLQEDVLVRLQQMGDAQFSTAKLCGGTALDRCWLGHRMSWDLDFFLPGGFGAGRNRFAVMAILLRVAVSL